MSITSKFLTLSIREQLLITIIILTIFSIIVILCLPISFSYEILMEDYKKKKKFFYNEYKEYMESCFYFQSFSLLKYEEIIKRFAKQMDKYAKKEDIFKPVSPFIDTYNDTYPVQNLFDNNENDDNILYKYCYNIPQTCELDEEEKKSFTNLQEKYESLNGLIFSHDIGNRFKIPGYEIPIINSLAAVNIIDGIMFGFGKEGLYKLINTSDYSKINITNLLIYYNDIITQLISYTSYNYQNYLDSNLFLFKELFFKVVDELNYLPEINIFYEEDIDTAWALIYYIKAITEYYSTIDIANDKCYFLSCINTDGEGNDYKYYYYEFTLIKNYLELLSDILSNELNIDFIPLYTYNHTIISPEICSKFLLKQSNQMFNEKILNETYYKIYRGESNIGECFFDKKILENPKIKEILERNITHFLTIPNKIYQGLIKLNEPYYFMKYSFPNLNPLNKFLSDYLIIDQIDFILFAPFKQPIDYSEYIRNQYYNLFYLMIVLIIYIWMICLIINIIIYCKVAKQITEPIYKLQEAIENNNVKDESVFVYEYDDIINELFITCKELLTGNIDPSNIKKYSGQFNILNNKDEEQLIDKGKYEKNLIINNDKVYQLITEQQNMMDFGEEIDINDDINNEINERDNRRKKTNRSKMTIDNDTDNKDNIKLSKIEEDKEKDKNSYKTLFKLAQYLYYYRCKVEGNVININTNNSNNIDDKISKKNHNQKSKNEHKNKKSFSPNSPIENIEDKNISINVLPDKDLRYLWYMEMKKKNNRSFNYELSDDYEELFMDYFTNKNA